MGIDTTDLRLMVREVLREAMAARTPAATGPQGVHIATDADLQAFVASLAAPGAIEAVRAGTMKFTLAAVAATPAAAIALARSNAPVAVALDGVVSERKLTGIAPGTRVKLAAAAVVTPMAKDIARRLGLTFERIG